MEILDLIRRVRFALFAIMLPTYNNFVSAVKASYDERVINETFHKLNALFWHIPLG